MKATTKWEEWRQKNASKIFESIKWTNSPIKQIIVWDSYNFFEGVGYETLPVDDLRDFFGDGYKTKKGLKKYLIKRGVMPDLFLCHPSFLKKLTNFFAKSGNPDFA